MSREEYTHEEKPGASSTSTETGSEQLTPTEAALLDQPAAFVEYFRTHTAVVLAALQSECDALANYTGTAILRDTEQLIQEQADLEHDLTIADEVDPTDLTRANQERARRVAEGAHVEATVPGVQAAKVASERLLSEIMRHREHILTLNNAFVQTSFSHTSQETAAALEHVEDVYTTTEQQLNRMEDLVRNTAGIHARIES